MVKHPAFSRTPDFGQFALNGDWANAWRFPSGELPPSEKIASFIDDSEEISFEALFADAFFGARFQGTRTDIVDIAVHFTDALRETVAGKRFFDAFVKHIGVSAIGQKMACVEIGAVNNWHADGPIVLPARTCAPQNMDAHWQSISVSRLASNTSHQKAIEFVFESPFSHWFALPLSAQWDSSHALSESLFRSAYQYAAAIR